MGVKNVSGNHWGFLFYRRLDVTHNKKQVIDRFGHPSTFSPRSHETVKVFKNHPLVRENKVDNTE